MAERLTDKRVRALPLPKEGNRVYYDTEVTGFGVRITAGGARSFIFNYRVKATGVERRITIGAFPAWDVVAARERAKDLRRQVDVGGDPLSDLQEQRGAPTVADLARRFDEEHIAKLRPHTQRDHRSTLHRDIVPVLGQLKVAAVEFRHVERLFAKVSERAPIRANRMLAVLGRMFTLAIKWKLRTDNPVKGVQRNREHPRQRYLRPEELESLTKALAEHEDQDAADALRLLLLTGARRGEVLGARWDQIDLQAGTWVKPYGLVKQARDHRVPLSAPARQLLANRYECRDGSPWVFPGDLGGHRTSLRSPWETIRQRAGITGLRIHDLRHSYASHLASAGVGLHVIGGLLGHTQPRTTYRYAHLFDDPLREATEKVGVIISGDGGR